MSARSTSQRDERVVMLVAGFMTSAIVGLWVAVLNIALAVMQKSHGALLPNVSMRTSDTRSRDVMFTAYAVDRHVNSNFSRL